MEIFKINDEIVGIETFLSGSETSLFVYEFIKAVDNNLVPLTIKDSFDEYDPLYVFANYFPTKLVKFANKLFDIFNIDSASGFDTIYDAKSISLEEVIDPLAKYSALVPLNRGIQIKTGNGDNFVVEPQSVVFLPSSSAAEFMSTDGPENIPFIIASMH